MKLTKLHKQAIVRAIMQDTPQPDRKKWAEDIKAAIVKAMSPEVRKLYKTKPDALRHASVMYTHEFRTWGNDIPVGDVTKDKLEEIIEPYEKQVMERQGMERKLTAAFEGITTLKQAESTFPEFKKYYPTEAQPTKNLPALANVVADLSKMGWPKTSGSSTT
jgi:hypothetical protein